MDRREFIQQSCKCALLCASPIALTTLQSCEDNEADKTIDNNNGGNISKTILEFDMNNSSYNTLKSTGNSIVVPGNSIDAKGFLFFRQSNSTIRTYSRNCTHAGGVIGPLISGLSTCPNHGAKYDEMGNPTNGVSNQSLKQYPSEIIGDIIKVSSN